jgi:hypothetical protein
VHVGVQEAHLMKRQERDADLCNSAVTLTRSTCGLQPHLQITGCQFVEYDHMFVLEEGVALLVVLADCTSTGQYTVCQWKVRKARMNFLTQKLQDLDLATISNIFVLVAHHLHGDLQNFAANFALCQVSYPILLSDPL